MINPTQELLVTCELAASGVKSENNRLCVLVWFASLDHALRLFFAIYSTTNPIYKLTAYVYQTSLFSVKKTCCQFM